MKKLAAIGAAALFSSTAHALTLYPDFVDFGNVPVGGSLTRTVTVTNDSDFVVENIVVGLSGNDGEYTLLSDCAQLSGQVSCTITLTLKPEHYGAKRKRLNIDGIEVDYSTNPRLESEVSFTVPIIGTSTHPDTLPLP